MTQTDNRVDEKAREEEESGIVSGLYFPRLSTEPRLPHYYGDSVRRIFMGAAAVIFLFAPFSIAFVPLLLPFEIIGAIVIIVLGSLTNPKNSTVMMGNVIASGIGIVMFELSALVSYSKGELLMFAAHEMLALLFVFALYFALKTLRSMILGQIGKTPLPGEFRKTWQEKAWYTQDPRNN